MTHTPGLALGLWQFPFCASVFSLEMRIIVESYLFELCKLTVGTHKKIRKHSVRLPGWWGLLVTGQGMLQYDHGMKTVYIFFVWPALKFYSWQMLKFWNDSHYFHFWSYSRTLPICIILQCKFTQEKKNRGSTVILEGITDSHDSVSPSVVSNTLRSHGLWPARCLCL